MTAATSSTTTPAGRVLALATTEVGLVLRNRTVAVSSVVVPLALGVFWAFTFGSDGDPARHAVVIALQLSVVLGMGIYVTATQTLVARRHARVLKRLRTTGLSDRGLLTATVAPSVVLGIAQLLIFVVINTVTGAPLPSDVFPLVLAVLGGIVLAVTAALATTVVTPSPERAQITTLPMVFVLLGGAIVMSVIPLTGWGQALVVVPGAAIGALVQLGMTGATWSAGAAGLPLVLPAVVALIVWPVVFSMVAARKFRWDPRR
jgi:ABC-2 type transport system permease protein